MPLAARGLTAAQAGDVEVGCLASVFALVLAWRGGQGIRRRAGRA